MSKVSVIIPTYNCATYISEAIDSVLAQTYNDFEIIIVDDGSKDNTREILKDYLTKNNIKYVYQDNRGLPAARNFGIKICEGEYIALLDADDELMPDALEKCISVLYNFDADWCITDLLRIENNMKEIRLSDIPKNDYFLNILKRDFIRMGLLYRKKAIFDIGLYDESMCIREDWDFKIRLLAAGKKFIYLNEPLYIYKIRKNSLVKNNLKRVLFFTKKLLKKHHKVLADNGNKSVAKIYSKNLLDLAQQYFYEDKNVKQAICCISESLKYDLNLKKLMRILLSPLKRLGVINAKG